MSNKEKLTMTVKEAAEISGIGIRKLYEIAKQPDCTFILKVGPRKILVKKEAFEEYVRNTKEL